MSARPWMRPERPYEVAVGGKGMIPMRDGGRLAASLYLPARHGEASNGRLPALLERTPYGTRGFERVEDNGKLNSRHGALWCCPSAGIGLAERGIWLGNHRKEAHDV